jgi:hypothetical protein
MTDPNKQSLGPCFANEAVTGTAQLTAANSVSYLFGLPPEEDKNPTVAPPGVTFGIDAARAYAQRFPTSLARKFGGKMTWKHKYLPTNAQHAYRMLPTATSAVPNTLTVLNTTQKKTQTIRLESKGGTNPRRWQAVGAMATALRVIMEREKPYTVEEEFEFRSLEDQGDRVALTTAPVFPSSQDKPYHGIAALSLAGADLPNVNRVEITLAQQPHASTTGVKSQVVYSGDLAPVQVALHGLLLDNAVWDELFDGTDTSELVVRCNQVDNSAYYIQWTLNNVLWSNEVAAVPYGGDEGLAYSAAMCQAVSAQVAFVWGGADFATHYP